MNVASGVLSIICASKGDTPLWGLRAYEWAWIFIGIAAVADFLDGFMARLLHAYSNLGKELDSLCDLVSFGVAPAIIMYNALEIAGAPGWTGWFVLLIPAFGALRLAKFNIDTRQTTSFIGLPIPANAIFWIGTLGWVEQHGYPGDWVMAVLIAAMSFLMVSEVRMYSLKFAGLGFRENARRYIMLLAALTFVLTSGIAGLAWAIIFYIISSLLGKRTAPESAE